MSGSHVHSVVVVCPECSAIYTPDVQGINGRLVHEAQEMRDALYALAPLAQAPGVPGVVRDKMLGNIRKALQQAQ